MIQNRTSSENSSFQNNINDISSINSINITNKRNTNEKKENNDNDLLSNSRTSISSNKDCYNNLVSKIKLDFHLNNPQERTQTIILHTSLNKSYSELNDSLTQNDYNNEQKYDNISKDQNLNYDLNNNNNNNIEGKDFDQFNNGFFLDNSSQYRKNINNLNKSDLYNNKRNVLNNINNLYEKENMMDKNDLNDNNQSDKIKKDKLTINFNNNMFFVNDNNKSKMNQDKYHNIPLDNIFNNFKKTSEDTFKNKVFLSNNDFDNNYPGLKKDENNKNLNIVLPYGYQNNAFCGPKQNQNNKNIMNSNQIEQNPSNYNFNNKDNSSLNDLSTNLTTNNDNLNFGKKNNNNKGISPFNYGNNGSSTNSLQNYGNSLLDLNNNKNNDNINPNDKLNIKYSFNPNNNINNNNDNDNDNNNQNNDINYTSKIFPKDNNISNNMNNQNYPIYENNNNNEIENSDNYSNRKIMEKNKNYFPQLKNDLYQTQLEQNNENNNNNINNNNNNNYQREFTFNPNSYNINNNNNDEIKQNSNYYPLDIIPKNHDSNNNEGEIVLHRKRSNSLIVIMDNNKNIEINKNTKNRKYNLLRSLLYGLLFGSTTTVLFWLRKEDNRQFLMEKYNKINFNSIIYLFKSILNPIEFFKKIFSKEKREIYLKVLGITFGKLYDFLEKCGDGFRLLGIFLFIYGIWLIIKSLIKMAIKNSEIKLEFPIFN